MLRETATIRKRPATAALQHAQPSTRSDVEHRATCDQERSLRDQGAFPSSRLRQNSLDSPVKRPMHGVGLNVRARVGNQDKHAIGSNRDRNNGTAVHARRHHLPKGVGVKHIPFFERWAASRNRASPPGNAILLPPRILFRNDPTIGVVGLPLTCATDGHCVDLREGLLMSYDKRHGRHENERN